jgi:hypothetical protein
MTNPAGQEPGEGVPERMNDQGSKGRVLGQKKPRQRRAKRCPSCLLLTDQEIQVMEERNELLRLQLRRIKMEEEAEREKIRMLQIARRQSQQRLVAQNDQFINCLPIRPHPQEVQLPQRNPQARVEQYPRKQTWQTGVQSRIKQRKRDATTPRPQSKRKPKRKRKSKSKPKPCPTQSFLLPISPPRPKSPLRASNGQLHGSPYDPAQKIVQWRSKVHNTPLNATQAASYIGSGYRTLPYHDEGYERREKAFLPQESSRRDASPLGRMRYPEQARYGSDARIADENTQPQVYRIKPEPFQVQCPICDGWGHDDRSCPHA